MLAKQKGMTFLGFLIVAIIGLSLVLAGIKIVPNYIEFFILNYFPYTKNYTYLKQESFLALKKHLLPSAISLTLAV